MARYVSIQTDDRVHDIARLFDGHPDWVVLGEIDSVNYGEGYDLRFGDTPVRLFDTERSDEVLRDPRFKWGKNWDTVFEDVVRRLQGKVSLWIEIDRYDETTAEPQEEAVVSTHELLTGAGYQVTIDASP